MGGIRGQLRPRNHRIGCGPCMLECICMRTTVEIRDDQHAALAALASRRGLRGFSKLVEEALDVYLDGRRRDLVEDALALEGLLSDDEATELRSRIDQAWSTWPPAS
jgi:hypothetical protein